MALRVCVLASGSSGNCIYVGSEETGILIDAGVSGKATAERLGEIGVTPESLAAICLTHEHDDHKASLHVLHRRYDVGLYANSGTIDALGHNPKLSGLPWNIFTTGQPFEIGDLVLEPFRVPHDSYDPVGFVVRCGEARIGVATDMGMATELVRQRLRNCGALVLEANHDEAMLQASGRPWALKQRIAGRQGHLSNTKAADLIVEVAGSTLQTVFLAHLSRDCNTQALALSTVQKILGREGMSHVDVKMTHASRISDLAVVP